jgi:hypothetical protein
MDGGLFKPDFIGLLSFRDTHHRRRYLGLWNAISAWISDSIVSSLIQHCQSELHESAAFTPQHSSVRNAMSGRLK